MKKVLVGGRFNIVHPGHVFFLKKAKALGDYLIVVVANDKMIKRNSKTVIHSQNERKKGIEKLGFVDKAVIGHPDDIMKTVERERPDIIALGYDQKFNEKGLEKSANSMGIKCSVVRMPELKGYKTRDILNEKKKKFRILKH